VCTRTVERATDEPVDVAAVEFDTRLRRRLARGDLLGPSFIPTPYGAQRIRTPHPRARPTGGDTARVIGRRRDGAAVEPGTGLPRGLALLVAGAFFMEILDGTVIAPAAPLIAADLGHPRRRRQRRGSRPTWSRSPC
jgi:hypothetical protein